MKKKFMKLAAYLVVLCMMFAMVGCGSSKDDADDDSDKKEKVEKEDKDYKDDDEDEDDEDEASIEGEWEAEIAIGEAINEMLGAEDEDMASYLDFSDVTVTMVMEFDDDGNYVQSFAKKSVEAFVDDVMDIYSDGMKDYMEEQLEAQGTTLDEYLEEQDVTWDELIESSLNPEDLLEAFFDVDGEEGTYELDGKKLYLDGEEDEYVKIQLTSKKMVWKELVTDDDESAEAASFMFPLEFKKQ